MPWLYRENLVLRMSVDPWSLSDLIEVWSPLLSSGSLGVLDEHVLIQGLPLMIERLEDCTPDSMNISRFSVLMGLKGSVRHFCCSPKMGSLRRASRTERQELLPFSPGTL